MSIIYYSSYAPNYYGGDIVIDPPYVVQPITNRLVRFDIFIHNDEEDNLVIPTNGDFSSADIYFSVSNELLEEVVYIPNNALTIRSSSSITIPLTEVLTNRHTRLNYAFRNTSGNKVRQRGKIFVDYASSHT
jgi:hypothetical protein